MKVLKSSYVEYGETFFGGHKYEVAHVFGDYEIVDMDLKDFTKHKNLNWIPDSYEGVIYHVYQIDLTGEVVDI